MKKYILILGFIFVSNSLIIGQVKRALFLGNSYTTVNNLPEKVAMLASSLGDSLYYDSNTPGGYRLLNHATNTTTLSKISDEEWDFVIIQAQSQEPSWSPSQLATEVLPYATVLNDSIKSNYSCSETLFYMTWGRKYGDQQNCANWPPVCSYLGMQERLMAGYMTMAEENNSTVAPVGLAWKYAMDNDTDSLLNLYSGDNSHPSLAGTYLSACVFYASIFQKSPVGSSYNAGLSEADALVLQQVAEDVVLGEEYEFTFADGYTNIDYDLGWESWFDYGNLLFAGFSYSANGNAIDFVDHSLNAESYSWNFGDGDTSNLQNPSHTYVEGVNYVVSQTISNLCFENSVQDTIQFVTGISENVNNSSVVKVYPNPTNGKFIVVVDAQGNYNRVYYKVFDVNGKVISRSEVMEENGLFSKQIDLSSFTNGIYFLRIYLDDQVVDKTIVKE